MATNTEPKTNLSRDLNSLQCKNFSCQACGWKQPGINKRVIFSGSMNSTPHLTFDCNLLSNKQEAWTICSYDSIHYSLKHN